MYNLYFQLDSYMTINYALKSKRDVSFVNLKLSLALKQKSPVSLVQNVRLAF